MAQESRFELSVQQIVLASISRIVCSESHTSLALAIYRGKCNEGANEHNDVCQRQRQGE